jgi:hydrogenase expression/formation protein HypC
MCLAIPGQIEQLYEQDGLKMAKVNFGGIRRAACLQYTPDAQEGEYVLVHVGFAISTINAEQAEATYKFLQGEEIDL